MAKVDFEIVSLDREYPLLAELLYHDRMHAVMYRNRALAAKRSAS